MPFVTIRIQRGLGLSLLIEMFPTGEEIMAKEKYPILKESGSIISRHQDIYTFWAQYQMGY